MQTEQQNPKTLDLDMMSTDEIVSVINDEDKQVAFAVEKALPAIAQAVDLIVEQIQRGGRLIYVGAGTSGRLGILDAVECVPTFNTPPGLVQALIAGGERAFVDAVEGAEDSFEAAEADLVEISLHMEDVIVGIAASGHTPYTLGALGYAKSIGAKTVGLACNMPSPLLDQSDIAIGVPVGAEVIAGSTRMKAGTAQKLVLNMISTASMIKLGKVYRNFMVDLQITNMKLQHRACGIVGQIAKVDETKAAALIHNAQGSVKTALVIHFKRIGYSEAQQLLKQTNGRLRQIIG